MVSQEPPLERSMTIFFCFSYFIFKIQYFNCAESKYRNLCALCDNPTGCYDSDKYHGREGALLCFTEGAADVAWVRLDDALRHFKVSLIFLFSSRNIFL